MARDFTLSLYKDLIKAAKDAGYELTSYEDFVDNKQSGRSYILRHDVDALPLNSLRTAEAEAEIGVKGTYYFRIVKQSFHPEVIKKIASLGHEIGYHYEDLALCHGDKDKAYDQFRTNLETFRKFYPVRTICMHGSPLSKWDNRDMWGRFNYQQDGIIAEPYFDTDFKKVFYITDTSRKWNASGMSVRDKVDTPFEMKIESTFDLIRLLNEKKLTPQIMQNIHPQRWTDSFFGWSKEFVLQNIKNVVKGIIVKK